MAVVQAVCISEKKGTAKTNRHSAVFIKDWGIEGDAHAGKWHRQVSLLSADKIEAFRRRASEKKAFSPHTPDEQAFQIPYGAFGENLVVSGIDFSSLPVGTRFSCNGVELELTQIGKKCHDHCEIYQRMGECIMPHEGVFTKVIKGGTINEGDTMQYQLPFTAAVITVSDSGAAGTRTDTSGPAVTSFLEKNGYRVVYTAIIPDDREKIASELRMLSDTGADGQTVQLICTTGGTGFSPRDVTPEATLDVTERIVPGIPEAMRMQSLAVTPRAVLSRAAAGIRKQTLIVNLPGSPKACTECLSFILSPLAHGLSVLSGSVQNCAQ